MSLHEDLLRMRHMLDYSREAIQLSAGRLRADLDSDRLLNLALTRLVEIVGEAASRVSASKRKDHPEIPWSEIVALRNRVIHGYDSVDFDILWRILSDDLPPLASTLERILEPPSTGAQAPE